MGRKPKLRTNFHLDVQYLLRLKYSVECDPRWNAIPDQRDTLIGKINELAQYLMNIPQPSQQETSHG